VFVGIRQSQLESLQRTVELTQTLHSQFSGRSHSER